MLMSESYISIFSRIARDYRDKVPRHFFSLAAARAGISGASRGFAGGV